MPRHFPTGWRIRQRLPTPLIRWGYPRILLWSRATRPRQCLGCRATAWWIGQRRKCRSCKKRFRRSIQGRRSGEFGCGHRRWLELRSLFHRDALDLEARAHEQRSGANEGAGGKWRPKKSAIHLVEWSEQGNIRTIDRQRNDVLQGEVGAGKGVANSFE